jgi:16S rRNA (uracil1498-N3)-methyltransferase
MTYFLSDCPLRAGEQVELTGEEAHHAAGTRRLRPGETFALQDPSGARFRVAVEGGNARALRVRVLEPLAVPALPPLRVTLLQAAVKTKAAEWILQKCQKCTELGVARIVFFPAAHSTVAPKELRQDRTRGRWERIAWEACKQSDRQFPPELHLADDLAEAIRWAGPAALSRVFHPGAGEPACALRADPPSAGAAARLLVGPEGGLTAEELRLARDQGFAAVALGELVLRAETAAVAACALALFGT